MASPAKAKPTEPTVGLVPLEEQIRQLAYQVYLQRGGEDGSELDDWLQAESELRAAPSKIESV
jgi:hypothetical protein